MFSQTVEYALRAVVLLADRREETPMTTQEIAAGTHVPADYLFKVLRQLARGGVLNVQRGKHGGFTLAIPATRLSVLDVVNVVDPVQRIRKCPLDLEAHSKKLCPLHKRLDEAAVMIEQAFGETPIAELIDSKNVVRPLCNIGGLVHA